MDESKRVALGTAALVAGIALLLAGSLFAHFAGLAAEDSLQRPIYPSFPRGWGWVLIGQMTALAGSQVAMAGVLLGWLYQRQMTWARASIGAALFTAEMIIVFGVIPNEWLTLTQATFEWTPQKIAFTVPRWLVLNNDVQISYAAIKDLVSAGYVTTAIAVIAIIMYQVQERQKRAATAPPPAPVSPYGRPILKGDR